MSSFDIVAIGEPMVEFNQTRAGEPNYLQGFGGDTSNTIIAAARAGARTAYVTRLGDDDFGRLLLDLWRREGVDASGVGIDPQAHTAVYFVTHGASGHVFSYLRAGSAASRMQPEHLPLDLIRGARFVQASGISLGISRKRVRCGAHRFRSGPRCGREGRARFQFTSQALAARARPSRDRRGSGHVGLFFP